MADLPEPITGYEDFLTDLAQSIRYSQLRAGLAVNQEVVMLYWRIGRGILEQQRAS